MDGVFLSHEHGLDFDFSLLCCENSINQSIIYFIPFFAICADHTGVNNIYHIQYYFIRVGFLPDNIILLMTLRVQELCV